MQNFKTQLYHNELEEIETLMKFAGYSNNFIVYVCNYFQTLFENAYIYSTTATKQLNYYVNVGTITYNLDKSKDDLSEHIKDINVFLENNSDFKKYCYLFFKDVEKFEVLIIDKLFNDYALKYDYTDEELEKINKIKDVEKYEKKKN